MIQYYIDELMSEGITYLPPFENSHGRPRTKSASEALVANPEQTEEDGNALPIASSAIEVADVETLGARSGKHINAPNNTSDDTCILLVQAVHKVPIVETKTTLYHIFFFSESQIISLMMTISKDFLANLAQKKRISLLRSVHGNTL